MITRDVAILIPSRGRERLLARLLDDMARGFGPALAAGGLSHTIVVYAQGYSPAYLAGLAAVHAAAVAAGDLVLVEPAGPHARIGEVAHAAIAALNTHARYRLAMLADDDSTYEADPAVDANLCRAARDFLDRGDRAYSIKLGPGTELVYAPFVDPAGPIMPFKEKMLWVSRAVLAEALATRRFRELDIGEDAVIAALAWRTDPAACCAVHGLGTFLHLGYEGFAGDGEGSGEEIAGGYAALVGHSGPPDAAAPHGKFDAALRSGVTPHAIMPEIFVGPDHPHYIFNGIRPEAMARLRAAGLLSFGSG